MPFGQCKLCQKSKELRRSHLIGQSIINATREPSPRRLDPIVVSPDLVVSTPRPIRDWLLCHDCEQRFSRRGESWVSRNVARRGGFPLHEIVTKAEPVAQDARLALYEGASIPRLHIDKLAYLGLSVFWRSSVHEWPYIRTVPRPDLGPHQELLRRFLLDEAEFPDDMLLQISLWPCEPTNLNIFLPIERECHPFREFWLVIPGIRYLLFVGKEIPDELKTMCACSGPKRMIAISKEPDGFLWSQVAQMGRIARHSRNVTELLARLK